MDPKQYKFQQELLRKLQQGSNPMDEKTLNKILKNAKESKYDYIQQSLIESHKKKIDEIDKLCGTGKYKTNKTNILSRLISNMSNDTKSWILSVTGVSMLMIFLFIMYTYNIILWVLVGMLCLVMFGAISYIVKELIKMNMFDDYED